MRQGIQLKDLERKICEPATNAFHVDSVLFRIDGRQCFERYHPEIHRRTENALRCPIHPTAKAVGFSRPKPARPGAPKAYLASKER